MEAEIVAIGSELTNGSKLDTNSQWLSIELAALGIPVRRHVSVADDLPAMVATLQQAVGEAELVMVTGGLGPTLDDLTREAFAQLCGQPLELDEDSLAVIQQMFARRRRAMPERNRIQAMFPAGSTPLPNPRGTAPGIWLPVMRPDGSTSCLAALPGVPSEMRVMFHEQVKPRLTAGDRVIQRWRIQCFGAGESDIEEMLGDLTARDHDPEVGITAHEATITLRITAHGSDAAECRQKIEAVETQVHAKLGQLVYGREDDELEHIVVRLLQQRGATVSTIESASQGQLIHRLLTADPCGKVVRQGQVVTAAEPAEPVTPSTYTLSVGPWSVAADGSLDSCRIRLSAADVDRETSVRAVGDPAIACSRTAKAALNLLRLHLLDTPE